MAESKLSWAYLSGASLMFLCHIGLIIYGFLGDAQATHNFVTSNEFRVALVGGLVVWVLAVIHTHNWTSKRLKEAKEAEEKIKDIEQRFKDNFTKLKEREEISTQVWDKLKGKLKHGGFPYIIIDNRDTFSAWNEPIVKVCCPKCEEDEVLLEDTLDHGKSRCPKCSKEFKNSIAYLNHAGYGYVSGQIASLIRT